MSLRANWLVALRAALALVFPFVFIPGHAGWLWAAAALLLVMGLSDLLDGIVARRSGKMSRVGELLDSMADGIARITALMAFLHTDLLPLLPVLLLVWRDLVSWSLRFMALGLGEDKPHKRLPGKVNGALQSALIGAVVLWALAQASGWPAAGPLDRLLPGLTWAAALVCLWSLTDLVLHERGTWFRFLGMVGGRLPDWRRRAE